MKPYAVVMLMALLGALIGGSAVVLLAEVTGLSVVEVPKYVPVEQEVLIPDWRPLDRSEQCAGMDPTGTLNLQGVSMLPTMKEGDTLLTIEYNRSKAIKQGDIVFLNDGNGTRYVHRVYGVYPEYFTTRGDNNDRADRVRHSYDNIVKIICGVLYN